MLCIPLDKVANEFPLVDKTISSMTSRYGKCHQTLCKDISTGIKWYIFSGVPHSNGHELVQDWMDTWFNPKKGHKINAPYGEPEYSKCRYVDICK